MGDWKYGIYLKVKYKVMSCVGSVQIQIEIYKGWCTATGILDAKV